MSDILRGKGKVLLGSYKCPDCGYQGMTPDHKCGEWHKYSQTLECDIKYINYGMLYELLWQNWTRPPRMKRIIPLNFSQYYANDGKD